MHSTSRAKNNMKRTAATLNDTTQSHERFRNFEQAENSEVRASHIFSDEKSRPQPDINNIVVAPGGPFSEDDIFSRDDDGVTRFSTGIARPNQP